MSVAVASLPSHHHDRHRLQTSSHLTARAGPSSTSTPSRMGAKSPVGNKKNHVVKSEDHPKAFSSPQHDAKATPPRSDLPHSGPGSGPGSVPGDPGPTKDAVGASNAEPSRPLAPPPRPAPSNVDDTPDYFSTLHHQSHLALEPNPFEQSFGNNAAETPGKSLLPPVAALASPASLLPSGAASAGFNWPNSLRSGPLSPAMLTGPAGTGDYFDGQLRAGFPTPNESSLRTGLTPGGGGSMFPAPSPNSQALFQQMAGGASTPSTLDFHRTAMNAAAAAARKPGSSLPVSNTSRPVDPPPTADVDRPDRPPAPAMKPDAASAASAADPFGAHDANDAANGLFLLAQARDGSQGRARYSVDVSNNPPPAPAPSADAAPPPSAAPGAAAGSPQASPTRTKRPARPAVSSVRGSLSGSATGLSEMSPDFSESGASEQAKANGRNKARKAAPPKNASTPANRRKAEDSPPTKAPASKKAKSSATAPPPPPPPPPPPLPPLQFDRASESADDFDEGDLPPEPANPSGRKMTDEEKRRNFLERNRVAALKCRQRKKQWLANLQAKVEIFGSENDALSAQVAQLREEIVNLKTLLLAHKDCPVSQAQGMAGMSVGGLGGDYAGHGHANPYAMAMANAGQVMAGRGVPRS
ncbi:MAG: hypothetical protein M1815_002941 [Lichina confinis]|nr:MAG: hypothetical protein M1815_002941 [Lichina confinis]